MRVNSWVAVAVIVALGSTCLVPSASAGEPASSVTTTHVDFQKAIVRAVEQQQTAASIENPLAPRRAAQPAMQRGYGGGGGHMMMVMSLVGMLAGIGTTYYMVKQIQKTTDQANQDK